MEREYGPCRQVMSRHPWVDPDPDAAHPLAMSRSGLSVRAGDGALDLSLMGQRVEAMVCGALWWPAEGVLVVSDLHLEKGSAFAARGQMLPPYDTRVTLDRIAHAMQARSPHIVVSLGDSFHDRRARQRMRDEDVQRVRGLAAQVDWIWITGNHDPAPPQDLGGRMLAEWSMGPLTFRHEAAEGDADGEVSGHYHPCARVVGRGGVVRSRCFVTDGRRLVMPAYGALTGGLNALEPAVQSLFPQGCEAAVLGPDGVYRTPLHRLAPDGTRSLRRRLPSGAGTLSDDQ
jgi:uncharacterized protein